MSQPATLHGDKIVVRNFKFALPPNFPKHWHGGRKSVTTFLDTLSIFFPEGERMFIDSVKAHRDVAQGNPELEKAIRAFCAQEGIHTREHERYNEMLRAQGYPIDELEGRVKEFIDRARRELTPRQLLAVTTALEHFTALLAHVVLTNPALFEGAHPEMTALWKWHAAEENEHKSVAFDTYMAAGGTYAERCRIMAIVTVSFWSHVLFFQAKMMKTDGIHFSLAEWRALFRHLFVEPGGMFEVVKLYFDYYRPDFHPWQLDNREVLNAWETELATSPVYSRA